MEGATDTRIYELRRKKWKLALLSAWANQHRPFYAKYVNLATIATFLFLIPFDFLLFDEPQLYSPLRFLEISICLLALSAMRLALKRSGSKSVVVSLSLWVPPLCANLLYFYYLSLAPESDRFTVLMGSLMVAFFSTFVLHRFSREQYLLTFFSLLAAVITIFWQPKISQELTLLIIAFSVSFAFVFYLRVSWIESLANTYRNLRSFIPSREAHLITVLQDPKAFDSVFKPTTRFNVCLCADWRNYHALSDRFDSETLSQFFDKFYGRCLKKLEEIVPSGTFFANWTADELFVIFYNEKDDRTITMSQALKFALALSDEIFNEMREELSFKLQFDIGLCEGEGYLGLLGPKGMKKTTITSKNANYAKRLEALAKDHRKKSEEFNSNKPILAMSRDLYYLFSVQYRDSKFDSREIQASGDLTNLSSVYLVKNKSLEPVNTVDFQGFSVKTK